MSAPIQLSRKKAARNPNALWKALMEYLAWAPPSQLTPVQRIAWLAYGYESLMIMAGHREYFLSSRRADLDEVGAALRAIGAAEQAALLASALGAVGDAGARAPEQYADRFIAGVERADLIDFDEAFERCTRSITDHLMDYVRVHESEFIEWRP